MSDRNYHEEITQFEAHYGYDASYMYALLAASTEGYRRFADFLPLSEYREQLPLNDHWVVKLAVMQQEDCGSCFELCIKMALEAGVEKALIKSILSGGVGLPENLKDIHQYALGIATNAIIDEDLIERIHTRYSQEQLLEVGICIGSTQLFPTIKRTIGAAVSCSTLASNLDDLVAA